MTSARAVPSQAALSPGLVFASVLALLAAATATGWLMRPAVGRVKSITHAERPSEDYYLANDHGGHVDHHVLYFGIDAAALDAMRRADVLLLGNSRLMFAARPRILDRFFESRGLRYYVLGFGFREADRFPLAVIERLDLRPTLVIVNADGFFIDQESEFASEVRNDSRFGAMQHRWEAETSHEFRRALHQLLPNWLQLFGRPGFASRPELVVYRSRANGTWQMSPWTLGDRPVGGRDVRQPPLTWLEEAAARRFETTIATRGSRLLLTFVPTPAPLGGGPALFAETLGVPLLNVQPAGLLTSDGDHLDEPSAIAWSEAFVRELGRVIP